ncbi:ABC transporter substrate-binding protein [Hydrogenophaga sp. 5NK40-0174]|uniref:ABC transporter substrate-binding protein n=1 Tax=Hydrogenophaga sp. 5NK40-0174 TaxID=3127649 RepID=UPI0031051EC2
MTRSILRRDFVQTLATVAGAAVLPGAAWAAKGAPTWEKTLQAAKGQTVYFNAWAGDAKINAYIQWAAKACEQAHGVKVEHVKISDAADVVKRVRAEKAAGRGPGEGTVDLIWINGENFAAMKREGLLFGPFAEQLPNWKWVDTEGKPTTRLDFSESTDGLEAPWGMAQLTFYADKARLPSPPDSIVGLMDLAQSQPGRITYPAPPSFHGTTFIKQALYELAADPKTLRQPVTPAIFKTQTTKLWAFLDALHPLLWRKGEQFTKSASDVRALMANGELIMGLTFNPNEAASEVAAGRMAPTTYSWQFPGGTIGNTHFVAIPFNAKAPEGAQVFANFLLSPQAQARKADIQYWGDPTVLAVERLPKAERSAFGQSLPPGSVEKPGPTLPEPHASWVEALETAWVKRYGQ